VITNLNSSKVTIIQSSRRAIAQLRLLKHPGEIFTLEAARGMVSIVDQGVVSLTNFLTGVIIGRACSKEEFGLYSLCFSIVLFLASFQTTLISTPYIVYSPRFEAFDRAAYTGSNLIHQFVISIFAIAGLSAAFLVLSTGMGPTGLAPVVGALAIAITFILMREFARRVLFSRLKFEHALFIDILVAMVQIGMLVILAKNGMLSARWTYYVMGLACGLATVVWFYFDHKNIELKPKQVFSDFRLNCQIGKWDFASGIMAVASIQLYTWFIAIFYGTEATGILAACLGLSFLVNPLILGLANYLGPKTMHAFTERGIGQVHHMVGRIIVIFSVLMSLYSIIMIIWGERLLQMTYGSKYAGFGFVVGLMALAKLAEVLPLGFHCGFYALEKADIYFRSQSLLLIISLTAGLFFVRAYGVAGVAYGLITANTAAAVYKWWAYRTLMADAVEAGTD
jgi:O-antigen/teichoic acid export membrane protein